MYVERKHKLVGTLSRVIKEYQECISNDVLAYTLLKVPTYKLSSFQPIFTLAEISLGFLRLCFM